MKKAIKIFAVILSLAIAMCIGVFATACNSEAKELTVKVVYPDNKPVDGTKDGNGDFNNNEVKVQFCDADNADNCYKLLTLGADGTLVLPLSEIKSVAAFKDVNNFSVHVLGLPEGYTYNQEITLNSKNASVTITLQAK